MLSKLFNWFQPGLRSRFTQPDLEKGETLDFNFSGTGGFILICSFSACSLHPLR